MSSFVTKMDPVYLHQTLLSCIEANSQRIYPIRKISQIAINALTTLTGTLNVSREIIIASAKLVPGQPLRLILSLDLPLSSILDSLKQAYLHLIGVAASIMALAAEILLFPFQIGALENLYVHRELGLASPDVKKPSPSPDPNIQKSETSPNHPTGSPPLKISQPEPSPPIPPEKEPSPLPQPQVIEDRLPSEPQKGQSNTPTTMSRMRKIQTDYQEYTREYNIISPNSFKLLDPAILKKRIENLRNLASRNFKYRAFALFDLGHLCLLMGQDNTPDLEKRGYQYLLRSHESNQKFAPALYLLGLCERQGKGVGENKAIAQYRFREFIKLVEAKKQEGIESDILEQTWHCTCFLEGFGVDRDLVKACNLACEIANAFPDDPFAIKVIKDCYRALVEYLKEAAAGDELVKKLEAKLIHYVSLSSTLLEDSTRIYKEQLGSTGRLLPVSEDALLKQYREQYGCVLTQSIKSRDPEAIARAMGLLETLVEDQSPLSSYALYDLGNCYFIGFKGTQNHEEAFTLTLESHELNPNFTLAIFTLAQFYANGIGCPPDIGAANRLYREFVQKIEERGAANVDIGEQQYYGTCFARGLGVGQDLPKAFKIFSSIAESNPEDCLSLYMVAGCLINGDGTPQDIDKGIAIFEKILELDKEGKVFLGKQALYNALVASAQKIPEHKGLKELIQRFEARGFNEAQTQ